MRNDAASALLDASRRALHNPDDVKHRVCDDFNDRIITNATCVREALIEVDLISASLGFTRRGRIFVTAARKPRLAFLHTGTR